MPQNGNGAPAVATQDDPDRTKLNAESIEQGPEIQAENAPSRITCDSMRIDEISEGLQFELLKHVHIANLGLCCLLEGNPWAALETMRQLWRHLRADMTPGSCELRLLLDKEARR